MESHKVWDGYNKKFRKDEVFGSIKTCQGATTGNVVVSQKSTSMQSQPTKNISQPIRTMETQETLIPKNSQTSICSVEASHVSLFPLLENVRVSKILEALYSMKFLESHKQSDQDFCFSRMSKDSSQQTMEGVSLQSSHHWMNWGMMSNGRFLTVKTLESHKIGKEYSLSDILEEKVADKYFLSKAAIKRLTNNNQGFHSQLYSQANIKSQEECL